MEQAEKLQQIAQTISKCDKCDLCQSRKNTVPGVFPDRDISVLLVGEAPGETEDMAGEPFVGQAGQVLNKVLNYIGVERQKLAIANVVKCRPPQNRTPLANEINCCKQYLFDQIYTIRPKLIVCMGKVACKAILGKDIAVTKEHGRLLPYVYQDTGELCGVLITLHPSAPLHNPNWHEIIKQDMMSIARMRIIRTHLEKMLAVRGEEALPCIPMPQH